MRGPQGIQGPAGADGLDGAEGPRGPAGGPPQFILKDNNGDPIGAVIAFDEVPQSAFFPGLFVQPRRMLTQLDFLIGGNPIFVALRLERTGFLFQHGVLYTQTNCFGPVFMTTAIASSDFGGALTSTATVGFGGVRSLYVPKVEAPVLRQILSVSQRGFCQNFSTPIETLSVSTELLSLNLHSLFPRPYTFEFP